MRTKELTVYKGRGANYNAPQIVLQGKWLQGLGFSIGDKVMKRPEYTGRKVSGNGARFISGGRKKFNVNFIVKTGGFLYNRDTVGASCIVSSAELQ